MSELEVQVLVVGPFAANCYLVANPDSGSLLVVDPGAEPEKILHHVENVALPVTGYLLTHGHADHISALPELLQAHPAPVFIHPRDATWAFSPANRIDPWYPPVHITPAARKDCTSSLPRGWEFLRVLPTPGHSPGSVCYLARHILFSGDTLFQGSVGRTDLPGGDPILMQQSLYHLAKLDSDIRVLPGHGPETTIGEELKSW